jgi:CubicO group peptidase (beta-lactamase class C family)
VLTKSDVDTWLDGYMPQALRSGDIPGAVVTVVKDGKILTARGFGYADVATRKPVDPERTLFRPGSVSKLVTWTAVMQQVEQGKIDLDRDVNAYLDFRIPPYQGKPVTMRQLMTHTGGFEETGKGIIFYDKKWDMPLGIT